MKKYVPYVVIALITILLTFLALNYFDQGQAVEETPVVTADILPVDTAFVPDSTALAPVPDETIVAGAELFPTKIMVQVCGPYMDVWAETGWKFGADEVDVSQPLPEKNTLYPDPNMSCGPDVMGLVAEGAPGSQVPTGGAEHITVIVFNGRNFSIIIILISKAREIWPRWTNRSWLWRILMS